MRSIEEVKVELKKAFKKAYELEGLVERGSNEALAQFCYVDALVEVEKFIVGASDSIAISPKEGYKYLGQKD